jgi:hypothetical protein
MRYIIVISSMLLSGATAATATTYVVNPEGTGDFPTIQAAINAAHYGDIIELTDGTFTGEGNRDIDYYGKSITVRSQSGNAEVCIIDCEGAGRGISCSGVSEDGALEGVTITGGAADLGGALFGPSSIVVTDCIFYRNHATAHGGAVHAFCSGSPRYVACKFIENTAGNCGGAFLSGYSSGACSPTFENCIFARNTAVRLGGAVSVNTCHMETAVFVGCTFVDNTAGEGGGGIKLQRTPATITGCTLSGNSCGNGGGIYMYAEVAMIDNTIIAFSPIGCSIYCWASAIPSVRCCDIYGNAGGDWVGPLAGQLGQNGNICEDPLFCMEANPDEPYTLHSNSPCAPDYYPVCGLIGAWPVGCGGTPVMSTTWGGIKALYRE